MPFFLCVDKKRYIFSEAEIILQIVSIETFGACTIDIVAELLRVE